MRGTLHTAKLALRHRLTRFKRAQDGITSLEFALLAPVFLLLITGIVEFSMIMFTSAVMESATSNTSRLGKTGYVPAGGTREAAIINELETRTGNLLDPTKIAISSEVYPGFSDVDSPEPCLNPVTPPCPGTIGVNFVDVNGNGQWDADMELAGYGNPGDVVVYTVSYPWPIMTPLVNQLIGDSITLTARSVVRNEPYGTGL